MLQVQEPTLLERVRSRQGVVGICGLGYVGLPLALTFGENGFPVLGFDIDERKIDALAKGESYIRNIDGGRVKKLQQPGGKAFGATMDFRRAREADVLIMWVQPPQTSAREPDMLFIENTSRSIGPHLRSGQLVVLESSTYTGTNARAVVPIRYEQSVAG